MANNIVVLGFDREFGAEGALEQILQWEQEGVIELEDAIQASRGTGTNIDIKQAKKQGGKSTLKGSGVGLLAGLLLGGPILGVAAGAGIGAILGSAKNNGLDDNFVEAITKSLKPESSALFLLVKQAKTEELEDKLHQFEGRVLTTSLPPEREAALRKMIDNE